MKKGLFIALVLSAGLWSCSQNDESNDTPDKYVNVTIGTESGEVKEKSIIEPGGTTSWDVNDVVKIIDTDGILQPFIYADQTPKSSAKFTGKLLSDQGAQVYKAFYTPENSKVTLKDGRYLHIEREDITIIESGIQNNSAVFGSYCPMVALPVQFDASDTSASKPFLFYHLMNMIEARISLRESDDRVHLEKLFDKVIFELKADGSQPFYKAIEVDLDLLNVNSKVEDLNECIVNYRSSDMTDYMYTVMNMQERKIGDLKKEYESLGSFPIPIFSLPTNLSFDYTATVSFYHKDVLQLKLQGSAQASRLNPVGLNVLDFDHNKIVN